jgi:hypothetical protein
MNALKPVQSLYLEVAQSLSHELPRPYVGSCLALPEAAQSQIYKLLSHCFGSCSVSITESTQSLQRKLIRSCLVSVAEADWKLLNLCTES